MVILVDKDGFTKIEKLPQTKSRWRIQIICSVKNKVNTSGDKGTTCATVHHFRLSEILLCSRKNKEIANHNLHGKVTGSEL